MPENTLVRAQLFLPLHDQSRAHFHFPDYNGRWWVMDTSYYGQKSKVVMDKEGYRSMIENAVHTMQTQKLEKVVLSRILDWQGERTIETADILEELARAYPSACVFQFELANGEEWIGATPEKLLVKRGKNWQTIALAGTQVLANKGRWGAKEIHEEEVVKDYIINILESNGAQNIHVSERYERTAGALVHLAHDIHFESDENVSFWAQLLHPTPAVCGLPKDLAMEYIRVSEPHARGYYTGLIGLEHPNGDADVFVLLRCMQRVTGGFLLYAGGGITAGSMSESEYNETESKANVIRHALDAIQSR
jgi:isochorismate synthase